MILKNFLALGFYWALAVSSHAHADPTMITSQIGNSVVLLPSPAGFADPATKAPELQRLGETFTPATNKLLAFFVSNDDIQLFLSGGNPELLRYFMIQSNRSNENKIITPNEYLQVKIVFRKQFQQELEKAVPNAEDQINNAVESVGKESGIDDVSVKVGEVKFKEVIFESTNSISLLVVTKYKIIIDDSISEMPMTMSVSAVLVKGKLIYFYAFSRLRSSQDFDWVRTETKNWLYRVGAEN